MTTKLAFGWQVGIGNVQSGTYDYLGRPQKLKSSSQYSVGILHGASSTSDWEATGVGWPHINKLRRILQNKGIPVWGAYMGGNYFGNAAACNAGGYIDVGRTWAAAQTGCSAAKVHLIGISMGAGAALRMAGINPGLVASVNGIVPAVSTQHLYTDNPNNVLTNGFPQLIAGGLGLGYRTITDGVTHGNNLLDSASGFTSVDVGRQITRPYNATGGIPANTTILSLNNANEAVMSQPATASASGLSLGLGDPLPMAGTAGYDLIGVHAPILKTNNVPNRWYYSDADPYIYPADVQAAASAAGGTAIKVSTSTGHTDATAALVDTWNSGTDFADLIAWIESNNP